jgi:hypothetical protein
VAYAIYPDAVTAALLGKPEFAPLVLGSGEAMTAFVAVAELIGPDLSAGDQPTTFLRFALSGTPVLQDAQPTIELMAQAPVSGLATSVNPNAAVSQGAAAAIRDGAGTMVASAHFEPPYTNNIYYMKIAIRRPGTRLSLRITNTTRQSRNFVWVAADNPADTQQPWVHATHRESPFINLDLSAPIGVEHSDVISITNFGTGPTTFRRASQAVTPPFFLTSEEETLSPNPAFPIGVRLSFSAPFTAEYFEPKTIDFVTENKVDPGPFGNGHNIKATFGARSFIPEEEGPVPDIVGLDFPDAIQSIRASGFIPRILGRQDPNGVGACVEQRPEANVFERFGERVRAYVAAPDVVDGQVIHDDFLGTDELLPDD